MDAPINMEAFENAVHTWFRDATEIETYWGIQSKTQPEYPFGVLQIIAGPVPAVPQWEVRDATNLSRPAGSEVELLSCVPCTFTVACQTWVGGEDRWHPSANARFHLSKAQAALAMPLYRNTLLAAGVSVVRTAAIQDISSIHEEAFVSRANMDIIFGAALNSAEYTGYIKKMRGLGTFTGTSETIDREFGDV